MKRSAIIGLLLLTCVLTACGGGAGGGKPVDVVRLVPKNVSQYMSFDLKALRTDDDLEDIYDQLEEQAEDQSEPLGIDLEDIDCVASAQTEEGGLQVLVGKFDMDEVAEELEDEDFDDDTYKGVDIWTKNHQAVAMFDNFIVVGSEDSVKDSIKAKQDDRSMYEDDDIRDVIDRLPGGLMLVVLVGEATGEKDLEVSGFSLSKKDDETLEITMWGKYEDADAAEDAESDLEDDLEDDMELSNIKIKRHGEFLEAKGELDIEDFEL